MTDKEMIEIKHGSENMCDLLNQEQAELKKDMIEEMAEILGYSCGSKSMDDCNEFDDCDECRATDFYNAGYCKIPEGSVVVRKETLTRLENRVAELEDKIENGTLLGLPCKVGDTVYEANCKNSKVYCHTVYKIELRECLIVYWIDGKGSKDYGYFGKDTFLTKAEAEAKLKEL